MFVKGILLSILLTQISANLNEIKFEKFTFDNCGDLNRCLSDEYVMKNFSATLVGSYIKQTDEKRSQLVNSVLIKEFNGRIINGPSRCNHFRINDTDLWEVEKACGLKVVDLQIMERYKDLIIDVFENHNFTEPNRKKYCPAFTEFAKERCETFKYNRDAFKRCNITSTIIELYVKPYEKCSKQIN